MQEGKRLKEERPVEKQRQEVQVQQRTKQPESKRPDEGGQADKQSVEGYAVCLVFQASISNADLVVISETALLSITPQSFA